MAHQFTSAQHVSHTRGNPAQAYEHWRSLQGAEPGLLLVDFSIQATWAGANSEQQLTAIYCLCRDGAVHFSVVDTPLSCSERDPEAQYECWLRQHGVARMTVGEALALAPVYIPKPWGQEIWFTGVERRGVCCVASAHGQTPIPWVQAAMPERRIGLSGEPLILLKILDPSARQVEGDLYFELHEEKQEVYVVTHIDRDAWPGGTGFIRYGFCPHKLAEFDDDDDFRSAYLSAVQQYERVRRALDSAAESESTPATSTVFEREAALRGVMDSFTYLRPLQVGDVVKVPLLTPHSLQHGVRTIEFQTPVYERKILSFAQRVLTQNHWDTAEAVAQMNLRTPPDSPPTVVQHDEQLIVERIVDFDDFEVHRVQVSRTMDLQGATTADYALLMVVAGELIIQGRVYSPEQALILPRGWVGQLVPGENTATATFLLAMPR